MTGFFALCWGLTCALLFAFITTRNLNLFTRVCLDTVYGFFTLFGLYVVEFLITNGNVPHYIFFVFALAFFATLSFIFPLKNKKSLDGKRKQKKKK